MADYAVKTLADLPAKAEVWAVGERVHERLADAGLPLRGLFTVANSVKAITQLVGQILVESEARRRHGEVTELHLFYNRPTSGAVYAPATQRLLPLDENWRRKLAELSWPTADSPEVMGDGIAALRALIREYLFVSLFRACAESLASENATRLRRCNAPTETSTNCWRTSTEHFIVCARMASMRNCPTSFPASKR